MSDITPEAIERVARELCRAEEINPDARCTWHRLAQLPTAAGVLVFIPEETPLAPAWHFHRDIAEKLLKVGLRE